MNGVRCVDSSNLTLTGNVFTGLAGQAVKAEGQCRRIAVVGNVAADPGRSRSQGLPAFDLTGASEAILGQNVVEK